MYEEFKCYSLQRAILKVKYFVIDDALPAIDINEKGEETPNPIKIFSAEGVC